MLKIKKSHKKKNEWIVYNVDNFSLHTHCSNFRVALAIKKNVELKRLPKSRNLRTLESHKRLTRNAAYLKQLELLINEVKG